MLEYGSVLHTFWECCVQRSYFCVDTKTLFKQCLISAIMNTSWYFTVFLTTPPDVCECRKTRGSGKCLTDSDEIELSYIHEYYYKIIETEM